MLHAFFARSLPLFELSNLDPFLASHQYFIKVEWYNTKKRVLENHFQCVCV